MLFLFRLYNFAILPDDFVVFLVAVANAALVWLATSFPASFSAFDWCGLLLQVFVDITLALFALWILWALKIGFSSEVSIRLLMDSALLILVHVSAVSSCSWNGSSACSTPSLVVLSG